MSHFKTYFLSILIFNLFTFSFSFGFFSFRGPHYLSIGPELYFMHRTKEGGSKQQGVLTGGRISYDRFRRSALYWGLEGMYASGTLNGRNSINQILLSRKRDSEIEGRFGYTIKRRGDNDLWFIPFFGAGYFEGTNRFITPSPMEYKIIVRFPYLVSGFYSRIDLNNLLAFGLNFKTKYSVGAKGKIFEDSESDIENSRFYIEDKFFYEVDVPIIFKKTYLNKKYELSFVPFYRFRHYGGHENYPYDFIDTKFHMYGARLLVNFIF